MRLIDLQHAIVRGRDPEVVQLMQNITADELRVWLREHGVGFFLRSLLGLEQSRRIFICHPLVCDELCQPENENEFRIAVQQEIVSFQRELQRSPNEDLRDHGRFLLNPHVFKTIRRVLDEPNNTDNLEFRILFMLINSLSLFKQSMQNSIATPSTSFLAYNAIAWLSIPQIFNKMIGMGQEVSLEHLRSEIAQAVVFDPTPGLSAYIIGYLKCCAEQVGPHKVQAFIDDLQVIAPQHMSEVLMRLKGAARDTGLNYLQRTPHIFAGLSFVLSVCLILDLNAFEELSELSRSEKRVELIAWIMHEYSQNAHYKHEVDRMISQGVVAELVGEHQNLMQRLYELQIQYLATLQPCQSQDSSRDRKRFRMQD